MITAQEFCHELDHRGVELLTGVPCSYFGAVLSRLEGQPDRYVPAANEGVAVAIAAGAELAGVRSAVLIQNSGFGNLLNPLTSLLLTYDIPVLIFMSLRGWPDPARDEPQHAVMGRTTQALLDTLDVPHWVLGPDAGDLATVLDAADEARAAGRPAFVLVPAKTLEPAPAADGPRPSFDRRAALSTLLPYVDDALVFTTTGYISRELYDLADRPLTFYMQGSMGHALGLGVGAALAQPGRRVIVVDGDGAALMHLGATATAGHVEPEGLVHVVLDNGAYESTGAQCTSSPIVEWVWLAAAAGYRTGRVCDSAQAFESALRATRFSLGPHLVVARIDTSPGQTPPRVTSGLTPVELRARFQTNACRSATPARPANPVVTALASLR
jgi:phosphonopyruvate decarboxylase